MVKAILLRDTKGDFLPNSPNIIKQARDKSKHILDPNVLFRFQRLIEEPTRITFITMLLQSVQSVTRKLISKASTDFLNPSLCYL